MEQREERYGGKCFDSSILPSKCCVCVWFQLLQRICFMERLSSLSSGLGTWAAFWPPPCRTERRIFGKATILINLSQLSSCLL
jgi:hypothetical protein